MTGPGDKSAGNGAASNGAASNGAAGNGSAPSGSGSSAGAGGKGLGERATPKRGLGPEGGVGAARGPAAFMAGRSTEKSLDFRGSSRRLLGTLRPQRLLVAASLALAMASVT